MGVLVLFQRCRPVDQAVPRPQVCVMLDRIVGEAHFAPVSTYACAEGVATIPQPTISIKVTASLISERINPGPTANFPSASSLLWLVGTAEVES